MYLATPTSEVQEQNETILEVGLRALAQMTQEEFEGLKLILRILKGGEIKCQKELLNIKER